jgi:Flp pilus assembly protein TadD
MQARLGHRMALGSALMGAALLAGCAGEAVRDSVLVTTNDAGAVRSPAAQSQSLLKVADSTMAAGNYEAALGLYRRAHEHNTWAFEPLYGEAMALQRMGHYEDAAKAFRRALEIKPYDPDATRELGHVLIALHRPALALAQFETVLKTKPDARTYNGLGVAKDMLGDHNGAQRDYRAALALAANHVAARNNLALSLAVTGHYAEAIELLQALAREPAATIRHRQNLALAYGLAGESERAAQVARRDLDEATVRQNLTFYATLRALNDPQRIAEAVGLVPRPVSADGTPIGYPGISSALGSGE